MAGSATSTQALRRPGLRSLPRPRWDAVAKRSIRAAIVIPGLFAFADKVIKNPNVATFASIGSFSVLLLADFGGPLRRRLIAYASLAVAGAVFITIATLCSRTTWLAVLVAGVVAALVLFLGILSGYVAKASTACLLILVLPLTLPASANAIPPRLEGWALASTVGTLAVFILWRDPPQAGLGTLAGNALQRLADHLRATLDGTPPEEGAVAVETAVAKLRTAYLATPFRPTGATLSEQAIVALVEEVDWLETLTAKHDDLPADGYARAATEDRELLMSSVTALHDAGTALRDADAGSTARVACKPCDEPALVIDLELLGELRLQAAAATSQRVNAWSAASIEADADVLECAFHARSVATATATAVSSALVASGNADHDAVRAEQSRWYGAAEGSQSGVGELARQALAQTSLRSVWLRNSLRGAIGFAIAVLVAKETGVQHGFWVVLGTLAVLRSNALGTGATALRALAGTSLGFIAGGALLVGIGHNTTALWIVLPFAVLLASYAPLRISFLAGQAAFTVLLAVLFNIVAPTGWRVGLVRVEDVAIGCAVSLVAGFLLWPRGAGPVVSVDLADAYRTGVTYLSSAVHSLIGQHATLGQQAVSESAAGDATAASRRLDVAFRVYLAEQGTKLVHRDEL
ncbi:MAG TPA: FUSC family protein, partial [Acidothermaceae bacterium]